MKRKKIFRTVEERAAWREAGKSIQDRLRAHIARIEAELAATKREST